MGEALSGVRAVIAQEVALGKLGERRSNTAEMTVFARRLVADLSDQDSRLTTLARDQNVELLSAEALGVDRKTEAAKDRLKKVTGAAFDRALLREISQVNTDGITLVQSAAASITEPAARQFLTDLETLLNREAAEIQHMSTLPPGTF
jgi:predicted outer membrane protein